MPKSTVAGIKEPNRFDILCGKGKECNGSEGSRRYRLVIDSYRQRYAEALTRHQKCAVTLEIYEVLAKASSRFLRYSEKKKAWEELPFLTARDKIGHALRFANRKGPKRTLPPMAAPSGVAVQPAPAAVMSTSILAQNRETNTAAAQLKPAANGTGQALNFLRSGSLPQQQVPSNSSAAAGFLCQVRQMAGQVPNQHWCLPNQSNSAVTATTQAQQEAQICQLKPGGGQQLNQMLNRLLVNHQSSGRGQHQQQQHAAMAPLLKQPQELGGTGASWNQGVQPHGLHLATTPVMPTSALQVASADAKPTGNAVTAQILGELAQDCALKPVARAPSRLMELEPNPILPPANIKSADNPNAASNGILEQAKQHLMLAFGQPGAGSSHSSTLSSMQKSTGSSLSLMELNAQEFLSGNATPNMSTHVRVVEFSKCGSGPVQDNLSSVKQAGALAEKRGGEPRSPSPLLSDGEDHWSLMQDSIDSIETIEDCCWESDDADSSPALAIKTP